MVCMFDFCVFFSNRFADATAADMDVPIVKDAPPEIGVAVTKDTKIRKRSM